FNITIGNGQVLLGGDTVFPLQAIPSADDPTRIVVAYSAPVGAGRTTLVEMPDASIKGGSLGGLLQYRSEALDSVQNDLGRLAAGLAMSVNVIHRDGFDVNGNPGQDFFLLGDPKIIESAGNKGSGVATVQLTDASKLTAHDYRVEFDGVNYQVTSVPGGSVVYHGETLPASFNGVEFSVSSGPPVAGDSWFVQPTRHAAGSLKLALQDASHIAAA